MSTKKISKLSKVECIAQLQFLGKKNFDARSSGLENLRNILSSVLKNKSEYKNDDGDLVVYFDHTKAPLKYKDLRQQLESNLETRQPKRSPKSSPELKHCFQTYSYSTGPLQGRNLEI